MPSRPPPNSPPPSPIVRDHDGGNWIVASAAIGGVLLTCFIVIFFVRLIRKKRRLPLEDSTTPFRPKSSSFSDNNVHSECMTEVVDLPDEHYKGKAPVEAARMGFQLETYTDEELRAMTDNFSDENIIGQGGFAHVYKGSLSNGKVVAIKQLLARDEKGEHQFRDEITVISQVHHKNLVTLLGYSISGDKRSLVFEYVGNNSLDHHLHGKNFPVLEWDNRMKIAIGAACGLAYLHHDCKPIIIHRDIKTANILLDNAFEAKVADFGLAKRPEDGKSHVTTRPLGTFGYISREYAASGKASQKSDVYAFGVVLLELVSGRKAVDPAADVVNIVDWARPLLKCPRQNSIFSGLEDPRLENSYNEAQMCKMIDIAAKCVCKKAERRPLMSKVLQELLESFTDSSNLSGRGELGESAAFSSSNSEHIAGLRHKAFRCGDNTLSYTESLTSGSEVHALNPQRS